MAIPYYLKPEMAPLKGRWGRPFKVEKVYDFTFLTDKEYKLYFGKLKSFSLAQFGYFDEDTIQKTLLDVYGNAKLFDHTKSSKWTWVCNIHRNNMKQTYIKSTKYNVMSLDTPISNQIGTDRTYGEIIPFKPDERLPDRLDDFEKIMDTILNDDTFYLIKLRVVNKFTYNQICESEGLHMSQVKTLLFQERLKLKEIYNYENEISI